MSQANAYTNRIRHTDPPAVSQKDVTEFLNETEFSGYQSVPLPYGYSVPGRDRRSTADAVLADRVVGKSLLDIGTYYGYFPYEAIRRGAVSAVGVEADPARCAIAQRIAELNGGTYTILRGYAEEIKFSERFDVVLFLNVLHHVTDPVQTMRNVASLSRETVIVEFCLASARNYIWHLGTNGKKPSRYKKICSSLQSYALRVVGRNLPLMAVGDRKYHRTFFFNETAFYNLFVRHLNLFSNIEFLPSSTNAHRKIAICSIASQ